MQQSLQTSTKLRTFSNTSKTLFQIQNIIHLYPKDNPLKAFTVSEKTNQIDLCRLLPYFS